MQNRNEKVNILDTVLLLLLLWSQYIVLYNINIIYCKVKYYTVYLLLWKVYNIFFPSPGLSLLTNKKVSSSTKFPCTYEQLNFQLLVHYFPYWFCLIVILTNRLHLFGTNSEYRLLLNVGAETIDASIAKGRNICLDA